MNNAVILLLFPVGAAFLIPLGLIISKQFGRLLGLVSYAAGALYGILLLPGVFSGPVSIIIGNWRPPFGINLFLSPLTLGIAVLIYVLAFFVIVFDLQNTKAKKGQYYLLYSLMVFSALGMVLTGDLFNLFVFLEIGGIASFACIGAGEGDDAAISGKGGLKYLIQAQLTSLLMLGGIALVYSAVGALNIAFIARFDFLKPAFAFFTALLIMLPILLEVKLFPFNTWVADAYNGAETSFSGSLSSILALAGGVVLMRLFLTMMNPGSIFGAATGRISTFLVIIGGLTVVMGELAALKETNLKKVLAFSSVGQMGMVVAGIGIAGAISIRGALLLIVSHSGAKLLLFLVAGLFIRATGKKTWRNMRGIARRLPIAGVLFIIGAMALMGIPMFAGFWGKLSVLKGALDAGGTAIAGFIAILIGTVIEGIYFMRIGHGFFENPKSDQNGAQDKAGPYPRAGYSVSFLVPAILLALALLFVGVYPQIIEPWLSAAAEELSEPAGYIETVLGTGGMM